MSDYTTPGGRVVPGATMEAIESAVIVTVGWRRAIMTVIDAWEDAKAAPVPAVPSGPKWHRVPAWEINQGDEYVATVHTQAIARSYVARGQGYTATEVTKERMCVFDRSPEEVANAGYRCYMCDREG